MFRAGLILSLTTISSIGVVRTAHAQTMTPTETQRGYNDRGVQHMFDGEYAQAAANFKSSLALGESNIAWLNYGRALFKMRRCHESRAAFGHVSDSPPVAAPSADEVALVLDRFSQEWGEACTGRLTIECPDEPTEIRLDDSEPFACHSDPIPVMPGVHNVSVAAWDESFAVAVADEPAMLSLQRSLTPPPVEEPAEDMAPEHLQRNEAIVARANPIRPLGLVVAATGIAALGTSLALEAAWVAPAFGDYEAARTEADWEVARDRVRNRQRANRVLFISGLGVTAIGATLFALPTRRDGVALRFGLSGPTSVAAEVKW